MILLLLALLLPPVLPPLRRVPLLLLLTLQAATRLPITCINSTTSPDHTKTMTRTPYASRTLGVIWHRRCPVIDHPSATLSLHPLSHFDHKTTPKLISLGWLRGGAEHRRSAGAREPVCFRLPALRAKTAQHHDVPGPLFSLPPKPLLPCQCNKGPESV